MKDLTPENQRAAIARAGIVHVIRAADAEFGGPAHHPPMTALQSIAEIAALVDPDTAGHVHRVAHHACTLASACGWSAASLKQLAVASLLHDVGKIAVSPHLLAKPGPLTQAERYAVERHTTFARTLLATCRSPELRMARAVATHHHERWDGGGYPHALSGTAIPSSARVVALADVFDALTSDRPYRAALSVETALGFISEGAGTQFDPTMAAVFLNLHREEARLCA